MLFIFQDYCSHHEELILQMNSFRIPQLEVGGATRLCASSAVYVVKKLLIWCATASLPIPFPIPCLASVVVSTLSFLALPCLLECGECMGGYIIIKVQYSVPG